MDTIAFTTSVSRLFSTLGSAAAPLLIDVRSANAYQTDSAVIASATWRDPSAVAQWMRYLPAHRSIVVYCVRGHEISKNTCSALRAAGFDAASLDGGIEAWRKAGHAVTAKQTALGIPSAVNQPSRWITRERPKIDRIACPWLIRRFIDPHAEFFYVPTAEVTEKADDLGAIPYDIPGVQFSHRGERCSFDALIEDFALSDPALTDLAAIVRGADTGKPGLTPQSPGLLAISLGLSHLHQDDHVMLQHGMMIYDALFAWLKGAHSEVHNADLFKTK